MESRLSLWPPWAPGLVWIRCVLVVVGIFCPMSGAQDVLVRKQPGEHVRITWSVQHHPIAQYDYVSILLDNHGVVMFCLKPFNKTCDVNLRDMTLASDPIVRSPDTIVTELGFVITDVTSSAAGHYKMEAVRRDPVTSQGTTEFRDAVIYIYSMPATPVIFGARSLRYGENITVSCSSELLSQPEDFQRPNSLTYAWYYRRTSVRTVENSFQLGTTGQVSNSKLPGHVVQNSNLTISGVSRNSSDYKYWCVASESDSSLVSNKSSDLVLDILYNENVRINILRHEKSTRNPDSTARTSQNGTGDQCPTQLQIQMFQRDQLTVECLSQCNPNCTYSWLTADGDVIGNDAIVTLNLERHGALTYICEASNVVGSVSQSICLDVLENPAITPVPTTTTTTSTTTTSTTTSTSTTTTTTIPTTTTPIPTTTTTIPTTTTTARTTTIPTTTTNPTTTTTTIPTTTTTTTAATTTTTTIPTTTTNPTTTTTMTIPTTTTTIPTTTTTIPTTTTTKIPTTTTTTIPTTTTENTTIIPVIIQTTVSGIDRGLGEEDDDLTIILAVSISVGLVVILILCCAVVCTLRKKRRRKKNLEALKEKDANHVALSEPTLSMYKSPGDICDGGVDLPDKRIATGIPNINDKPTPETQIPIIETTETTKKKKVPTATLR